MIPVPVSIVDKDLRLTPNAKSEIERIYLLRKLKPGQAMTEMGLNPLNVSIGNARIGGRIKNINTVKKLADWLELNKL